MARNTRKTETVSVLSLFRYTKQPGDVVISTVSRADNWQAGLSPFVLGPCELYGNYESKNMENAWQFAKVYKKHVAGDGEPSEEYFKWAIRGWNDKKAHRYPMGKGAVPEYSWWRGEALGYIEARKAIYAPLYARAVLKTHAWRTLKKVYAAAKKNGERLVLLDFDAYDHQALNMSLADVLNEPKKKMGHAFVLAMLLQADVALDEIEEFE